MMSKAHTYRVNLAWSGASAGATTSYRSYSRQWTARPEGRPPMEGSADPAFRGDPTLYNPEDLLVISLSACHMLTYLALAAQAGIEVVSYEDDALGTMSQLEKDFAFTDVLLKPRVVVADPARIEEAAALHAPAHRHCFIARSVNFPVRCEPRVVARGEAGD